MDDLKLILEVEKFGELYDPQNMFYKDNSKKDKSWDTVATVVGAPMEDCKRRWKQLRDTFVKKKNVANSSAGGSAKWKYMNVMSFLLPHLQLRSSKSHLQPLELGEEAPIEYLSCGEDDEVAGPSRLTSRPGTPLTPTLMSRSSSPHPTEVRQRSTTPPPHHRVPALSSASATQPPQSSRKEKRRGSTNAVPAEQQLLEILTAEKVPLPPHVPNDEEEMYFFALSLVPRLKRLPRRAQARAQMHILQYLTDLEQESEQRTQDASSVSRSSRQHRPQHHQHQH